MARKLLQASVEDLLNWGALVMERWLGQGDRRCFRHKRFVAFAAIVMLGGKAVAQQPAEPHRAGRDVFVQSCAACHVTGVAGAPRLGVDLDWRGRLGQGHRGLLGAVLRGKEAMPPKGGNASLSDKDASAALDFMLGRLAMNKLAQVPRP